MRYGNELCLPLLSFVLFLFHHYYYYYYHHHPLSFFFLIIIIIIIIILLLLLLLPWRILFMFQKFRGNEYKMSGCVVNWMKDWEEVVVLF